MPLADTPLESCATKSDTKYTPYFIVNILYLLQYFEKGFKYFPTENHF